METGTLNQGWPAAHQVERELPWRRIALAFVAILLGAQALGVGLRYFESRYVLRVAGHAAVDRTIRVVIPQTHGVHFGQVLGTYALPAGQTTVVIDARDPDWFAGSNDDLEFQVFDSGCRLVGAMNVQRDATTGIDVGFRGDVASTGVESLPDANTTMTPAAAPAPDPCAPGVPLAIVATVINSTARPVSVPPGIEIPACSRLTFSNLDVPPGPGDRFAADAATPVTPDELVAAGVHWPANPAVFTVDDRGIVPYENIDGFAIGGCTGRSIPAG